MKINNFIINMFKGMGIGIANVIPGVSGGTMAIVFGIYDKLIEALANFITASIKKKVEYIIFIAPIIIGAVVGILGFARIVEFLYANYPLYTKLIFVVLVLPSIPIVVKGERIKEIKNIIYFCLGMVFVLTFFMLVHKFSAEDMSFQIRKTFDTSYGIKLLFCGSLAGGAMIIPGISGSLLLLALGEHQ
ncbi:MAG: undecaprenyl phosphate translocase family protein, partial [Fusobacterium sp.]